MAELQVRERIAVALDVDDLVAATRIAKQVQPWVGVLKVGLELYSAVGPDSVIALHDLGFDPEFSGDRLDVVGRLLVPALVRPAGRGDEGNLGDVLQRCGRPTRRRVLGAGNTQPAKQPGQE